MSYSLSLPTATLKAPSQGSRFEAIMRTLGGVCSNSLIKVFPSRHRVQDSKWNQASRKALPNCVPTKAPDLRTKLLSVPPVVAPRKPYPIPHPMRHVFIPGHPHHGDIIVALPLFLHLLQEPDAKCDDRDHCNTSYHGTGYNGLVQADVRGVWWSWARGVAAGRQGRARQGRE